MRKVIMIGEEPKEESKGVEFTHYQHKDNGWNVNIYPTNHFEKVVYLGKCAQDGDLFACYANNRIDIYKGNLNNGTY